MAICYEIRLFEYAITVSHLLKLVVLPSIHLERYHAHLGSDLGLFPLDVLYVDAELLMVAQDRPPF